MDGIYVSDKYGNLEIWFSVDDFMNGKQSNMYLQNEYDIYEFLQENESEEEIFNSAEYVNM